MTKEQLNFVCEDNGYLKGGTKEACVKARDFIKYAMNHGNDLSSPLSCVSADEFIEAVKVLMAVAFTKEDEVPKTYRCENDCRKISYLLCPGECNLDRESSAVCSFYEDESLI